MLSNFLNYYSLCDKIFNIIFRNKNKTIKIGYFVRNEFGMKNILLQFVRNFPTFLQNTIQLRRNSKNDSQRNFRVQFITDKMPA